MLRLLKFLIFGDAHLHEWEVIGEDVITYTYNENNSSVDKKMFRLQCKKCGNVKTVKDK